MSKALGSWILVGCLAFASAACGGPSTSSNAVEPPPPPPPVDPGTPPNVTVNEDPVDFGFADCGGSAPDAKTVKITNSGGGTVAWTAELESTGFRIVGATSGTFSGGGSVNVKVRSAAIPTTAAAGAVSLATLVVIIDKAKIFRVPLRVTAQGGTLTVMPGETAFGDLPINVQAPDLPVAIKNTGNKDVTLSFKQPTLTDFALNWTGSPQAVTVAAGATVPGAVARFRPSKLTLQSTTAPITVKGAVCGTSATSVAMNGKGTGGVVGISPGQLDFGKVNCGGKAGFQVFTILNSGNSPFDWSAAFGLGAASSFDVSPVSGTVLAGSQASVFVTPKDIPATSAVTTNLYGDTLTVTTTATSDAPHPVTLLMTAKGAILAFTTKPNDYGTRGLFSAPLNQTATITNTGNAPANVVFAVGSPSFSAAPAGGTVAAGAGLNTTVAFAPALFGDVADQLGMKTSDVLCSPLPAAPALTGKGKGVATQISVGVAGRASSTQGRVASTCAVIGGGHLACWGNNNFGQIGNGTSGGTVETPVVVSTPPLVSFVAVAGGGQHNCGRTTTGAVYCWGLNNRGQLGSSGANKSTPTLVAGVTNVIALSAAHHHTCAVSAAAAGGASGKVYCWGLNARGQLGTAVNAVTKTGSATPLEIAGITDATSISAGSIGGCARRATGNVVCWGQMNYHGDLGDGTTTYNPNATPVTVTGVTTATAVTSHGERPSAQTSCALQANGTIVCWGKNQKGQVKSPVSYGEPTPVTIAGVSGATAVSAGRHHVCALVAGGGAKCWGGGALGQLGNGGNLPYSPPVDVTGLSGATQLSVAGHASCALLNTGSITCWGPNEFSELGNPAALGVTPSVVSGF